ncbi:MAG: hypothetical protein Q7U88_00705, partial [Desulfocapsaceae bacterium]|nr:hypothetical protein [Desulfocapsaceae bacterium]
CRCKNVLIPTDGLEVFSGSIYHGFQEIMFLGLAECLGMDDDLVLAVNLAMVHGAILLPVNTS